MDLDFDDLDIPISDANLSHLTSSSTSGNGSRDVNGGGRGGGKNVLTRLDVPGKQGRLNTFDRMDYHDVVDDEIEDEDEDQVGALGTGGMGMGMMDWQSIDPGGEFASLEVG